MFSIEKNEILNPSQIGKVLNKNVDSMYYPNGNTSTASLHYIHNNHYEEQEAKFI